LEIAGGEIWRCEMVKFSENGKFGRRGENLCDCLKFGDFAEISAVQNFKFNDFYSNFAARNFKFSDFGANFTTNFTPQPRKKGARWIA